MKGSIFRKSSLERISSPEQLNEYTKITNPRIWIVLLGCLAILIAVGYWAFYGSIPDTAKANGIIFSQNHVTTIIPATGGRIYDMRVTAGDFVEAGQIIAVIPQEDILNQIKELKNSDHPDKKHISDLINQYKSSSIIISPVSGIVLSAKSVNETASSTEPIVSVVKQEKYTDDKQIICYVKASTSKKLKDGMAVQVSPDFASREEYGYIYGHISKIGTYPVSQTDVLSAVGSTQYAMGLLPQGSCVEIRVTLTVDASSRDKIKWSNKKGEAMPLSIGTKCNMSIVIKNYKPYELILNKE